MGFNFIATIKFKWAYICDNLSTVQAVTIAILPLVQERVSKCFWKTLLYLIRRPLTVQISFKKEQSLSRRQVPNTNIFIEGPKMGSTGFLNE